jgi:tRNA modification GTPase
MKKNPMYNTDDTIAAISTPAGEGGIGIVRLSGKRALSLADKIFVSKDNERPSTFKTYTTHYGHIIRPQTKDYKLHGSQGHKVTRSQGYGARPGQNGLEQEESFSAPHTANRTPRTEIIDEVILTVMRAPRSYTKEDVVEINCHGGIVAMRKTLDLALGLGARLAEPGEFTKRAFLNGRIDLTQAEAVLDLISSKTESSMKVAMDQLDGELSTEIREIREAVLDAASDVEAKIDFPEEDTAPAGKEGLPERLRTVTHRMKRLLDNAWKGMILKEGIMCVICGKPNVGKSSLMNLLLRRNRVIVTPVPGTTRDAIEEEINLKGIPLRLVDTAGIAAAKNVVEEHGIRKSRSYIDRADLILFMLDMGRSWSKTDAEIYSAIRKKKTVIVANKSDVPRKLDMERVKRVTGTDDIIEVSLLRKRNVEKIEETVAGAIWKGEVLHPEGSFVTNIRQKKDLEHASACVKKAAANLKVQGSRAPEITASLLREAVLSLGSIIGETVEPDILERVFSKFCIGK